MPEILRQDNITLTAQDLTKTLIKSKDILNLQEKPLDALKQLVSIFEISTTPQRVNVINNSPEKTNLQNEGSTTSVDRTTPEAVHMEIYIHARRTRTNSNISIAETPIDPITPDNDEALPIISQYDQESP